jgi:hypothetical protein
LQPAANLPLLPGVKFSWKHFALLAFLAVGCWFAWWGVVNHLTPHSAERGQIGDLFGGINALFSGLALAGVVTAVILQSQELGYQRRELEQNREQLTKTAKANQAAAEALNKQIEMQLRAAELTAISALLVSVNAQIRSASLGGTTGSHDEMTAARKKYHARLHAILAEMDRPI